MNRRARLTPLWSRLLGVMLLALAGGAWAAEIAEIALTINGQGNVTGVPINGSSGPIFDITGAGSYLLDDYIVDTDIELTATASPGWVFAGWDGLAASCNTQHVCEVVFSGDDQLSATFVPVVADAEIYDPVTFAETSDIVQALLMGGDVSQAFDLTLEVGAGGGVEILDGVRFPPPDFDPVGYTGPSAFFGSLSIILPFETYRILAVRAVPSNGYLFSGWGGACEPLGVITDCMFLYTDVPSSAYARLSASFIADDDAPVISLVDDAFQFDEDAGIVQVKVTRSGNPDSPVSVDFALEDGSAVAGEDFEPLSGTLMFESGMIEQEIDIEIIDDVLIEPPPDETFTLTLSNPAGALLDIDSATIAIRDNDYTPPSIFAEFATASLSTSVLESIGTVNLAVELSEPAPATVSLNYTVRNGTALSTQDFVPCACTLTILQGQTMGSLSVQIVDDQLVESTETFTVTLDNVISPPDVGIGTDNLARLFIVDNDQMGQAGNSTISLQLDSLEVVEGQGGFFIRARREGDLDAAASVDFQVLGGTALPGEDFLVSGGASGTLDFVPGNQVTSRYVEVVDDSIEESTESLTVTLSNVMGAELGDSSVQVLILDNDADDLPPPLRTLRTDFAPPGAAVYGGVTTDGGITYTDAVVVNENIEIHVTLEPRPEDVGEMAQVVVIVRSAGNHVQVTPGGIQPLEITTVEATVPNLIPFADLMLTEQVDLNVLEFLGGSLTLTTAELGEYEIFVGYTTDDLSSGNWVFTYNDEPIDLAIGN